MKILKVAASLLLIIIVFLIWLAPLGPLPGFFIGGSATDVPARWSDTKPIHEIRLEVGDTGIPRVVIIWVVQVDGTLHVVGSRSSGWVSMLGQGGPVRMRMNGKTYTMEANLVTSGWEPILEAYQDKYRPDYPEIVEGFPSMEEAESAVSVFRLE